MIKILIDSSADLTPQEISQKKVIMIPLQVAIQDKTYLDGINLDHDTFYNILTSSSEFPKTSQPSPQAFLEAFEEVKANNDELICILLSSALSGTYQSAKLAKDMVDYDKIYLIDSLSAVSAIRILCDKALEMINNNIDTITIVETLNNLKGRIKIFAALNTLDYLSKGGRISKTVATIGDLTNIKPIITVSEEGKVEIAGKRLGVNKSISFIKEKGKREEYAFVNPRIVSESVKECYLESGEGCLSVDKPHEGFVYRHYKVTVKTYDLLKKSLMTYTFTGYPAIIVQHEMDHLKGVLFYDHINKENPFIRKSGAISI